MTDKVPFCPISHSQQPGLPRGTAPTRLPSIPVATDLPSMVRSINIMRDILRTLTTSLTVNNTYLPQAPRPPRALGSRTYIMSHTPDWEQTGTDTKTGFVGKDPKQRAYVKRIDGVNYRNNERDNDSPFRWLYKKPLTGEGGGGPVFEEDFFERVVRAHWKKKDDKPPEPDVKPRFSVIHHLVFGAWYHWTGDGYYEGPPFHYVGVEGGNSPPGVQFIGYSVYQLIATVPDLWHFIGIEPTKNPTPFVITHPHGGTVTSAIFAGIETISLTLDWSSIPLVARRGHFNSDNSFYYTTHPTTLEKFTVLAVAAAGDNHVVYTLKFDGVIHVDQTVPNPIPPTWPGEPQVP